jgi:hypothetical protein
MSMTFTRRSHGLALLLTAGLVAVSGALNGQTPGNPPMLSIPHDAGQTVAPIFEGWEPNPDGTFSLYFGYMNRNYKEQSEISIGPNNRIEAGEADRGQPTHFLPRRHKKMFRVVVPKDFGSQKLVWTLTIRDHTESVPASLNPLYQINTVKDFEDGNTPPVVRQAPDLTVTRPAAATVTIDVADDGLPKRRDRTSRTTVEWSKYRGPGAVTFSPPEGNVTNGKATTKVSFDQPGLYVLHALVDDGSKGGTACCWTNAQVTVTVR